MADAREVHVWTEHAERDHTTRQPYEHSSHIDALMAETKNVKTVIDYGCGSGLWRPCFRDYDYIGIDQNEAMIKVAKSRDFSGIKHKTSFMQRNFFRDGVLDTPVVDLVWTSAVLQHNRHEPDKRETVEHLRSVIRDGGYLLFTENTFTRFNHNPPFLNFEEGCTDGWSFTQQGWIDFIEKIGFKLIKNDPFNYYLFQKK